MKFSKLQKHWGKIFVVSAQKVPTTLLQGPSEDRQLKQKLIEPTDSSGSLRRKEVANQLSQGQGVGARNLTLWVAGLPLIITLESGGCCKDTKPAITYRIDPLKQR